MGSKQHDLTGQKHNDILVLKQVGSKKFGHTNKRMWECVCCCGVKLILPTSTIKKQLSCGCAKKESNKNNSIKSRHKLHKRTKEDAHRAVYRRYIHAALSRKLEFSLPEKLFFSMCESSCHYCNAAPYAECGTCKWDERPVYTGVDRKNNTIGYTVENCVPCCKVCNHAKHTMSYEEFVNWIKSTSRNLERVMKDVQDQTEEWQSAKVVEYTVRQLREGSWGSAPLHRAEDARKPTPPKANFSGVCGNYVWFVDSKGEVTYLKLPE
jgi:hypothetical protein